MRDVQQEIRQQLDRSDVVLFMKGVPDAPRCGFSATVASLLKQLGLKFTAVDVLADEEIRQGIKQFSNWPTIPQLYVKGEFLGGCDTVSEMQASGELETLLKKRGLLR